MQRIPGAIRNRTQDAALLDAGRPIHLQNLLLFELRVRLFNLVLSLAIIRLTRILLLSLANHGLESVESREHSATYG
jgi:hypothetical protein